jgi:cobalt-precorrin-5B (C1)-methyltransferase
VVFSTGGKSENFARETLEGWPIEAFVQIADFFAFSVRAALKMGFKGIVHSVFFGKAVKMAQGHAYTHAHKVAMDLEPLAALAGNAGHDAGVVRELTNANTAQHALSLLLEHGAEDLIEVIARQALAQSAKIAGHAIEVRLLLFDQKGSLLADVRTE